MNWTQLKSIHLSRICLILFAFMLTAMDIFAYWIVGWFMSVSQALSGLADGYFLLAVIYSCSIFAWVLLAALWKLLKNMRRSIVFEASNVRSLRQTSWCCFGACAICFASTFFYVPLFLIAIPAGFVGLIVRIVKNVFEQAILMKDELDFTV